MSDYDGEVFVEINEHDRALVAHKRRTTYTPMTLCGLDAHSGIGLIWTTREHFDSFRGQHHLCVECFPPFKVVNLPGVCTINGCCRKLYAQGLCRTHRWPNGKRGSAQAVAETADHERRKRL